MVTPAGLVLNDLQWHSVRLRRVQATLTLTVDGIYTSNAVTPGNFFEVRGAIYCQSQTEINN